MVYYNPLNLYYTNVIFTRNEKVLSVEIGHLYLSYLPYWSFFPCTYSYTNTLILIVLFLITYKRVKKRKLFDFTTVLVNRIVRGNTTARSRDVERSTCNPVLVVYLYLSPFSYIKLRYPPCFILVVFETLVRGEPRKLRRRKRPRGTVGGRTRAVIGTGKDGFG